MARPRVPSVLPANIVVTLSDDTTSTVPVVWNGGTPAYDGNVSGTYVFSGALTLPASITNPNGLTATAEDVDRGKPTVHDGKFRFKFGSNSNFIGRGVALIRNAIGSLVDS